MDTEKEINDLKTEVERLRKVIGTLQDDITKLRGECYTAEKQLRDEISKKKKI
jgi:predicted  nucleic acid-binding Zn-ribbon protein